MYRQHENVLLSNRQDVLLRPLRESDWRYLEKWNADSEILYYTEGDSITAYSTDEVKKIYEHVSHTAEIFIIENTGRVIGECWIQNMNIKNIIERNNLKLQYRIDLMIGEKEYWNHGIGSHVIAMLVEYGFKYKNADTIWGIVSDYNIRSINAFVKNDFEEYEKVREKDNPKAMFEIRMAIGRNNYKDKDIIRLTTASTR